MRPSLRDCTACSWKTQWRDRQRQHTRTLSTALTLQQRHAVHLVHAGTMHRPAVCRAWPVVLLPCMRCVCACVRMSRVT